MIALPNSSCSYEQIRTIEKILIPHNYFMRAVKRLQEVRKMALHGAEPRHTLLVGESGAGKTWVARYLQSAFPEKHEGGQRIIPILLVETPSIPSIKTLAEALLIALGDPLADRGTASTKRSRAMTLIRNCKVEMVIFDEFQHFLDHGRNNSLQSVADWLKLFVNEAKIPCLLMGLPRCEAILRVNEQLRRRFSTRLELPPFSIETAAGELEFRTVLNEIDKLLPTQRPSNFAEPLLARRMHFACNGLIGHVRKLIIGAFEIMTAENRSHIDLQTLEKAFIEQIWRDGMQSLNPFHAHFEFRSLNRPGEPFAAHTPVLKSSAMKNVR